MSPRFVDSTRERIRRWLWLLSLLWLAVACCVLGYDLWSEDFSASWVSRIYFGATLLFSGAAFGMYGWDKRQAQREGRRIPETLLHRLSMLGGWPGSILGQQLFRHKTQKVSFRLKATLILAAHLVIVLFVVYRFLLS